MVKKRAVEFADDDPVRIFVRFRPLSYGQIESDKIHVINSQMVQVDAELADSPVLDQTPRGQAPSRPGSQRRLLTSASPVTALSTTPTKAPLSGRRRLVTSPAQVAESAMPSPIPRSTSIHGGAFRFNEVFGARTDADVTYRATAAPMIASLFSGYNCTIMAYGQSGSGKTHTMMGYGENRGIIPRVMDAIFAEVVMRTAAGWSISVSVSNVQIYMEKVLDLLTDKTVSPDSTPSLNIRQRQNPDGTDEVYIEDVTWKKATSVDACLEWVERGARSRVVAATDLNSVSSRSHSVFTIQVEQVNLGNHEHLISQFNLVDLAGSETVRRTGAQGLTLQQAGYVNKSLSTLGNVISALADKKVHIPYRDSKLTRLLTHALGGNSKTAIILTCSMASIDLLETHSTLQFGKRAQAMKNKPKINKVLTLDDFKEMLARAEETMSRQKMVIESLEHENDRLLKVLAENTMPITDRVQQVLHQVDEVKRATFADRPPEMISDVIREEEEAAAAAADNDSLSSVSSSSSAYEPPKDPLVHVTRHIGHMRRSLQQEDGAAIVAALATESAPDNVMDMPQIATPVPREVTPAVVKDDHRDDSDNDEKHPTGRLTLPPIVRSTRPQAAALAVMSPAGRYFTPRSFTALSNDLVQGIQREKDELQRRLNAANEELNDLNNTIIELKDTQHNVHVARDLAREEPAKPKDVAPDKKVAPTPENREATTTPNGDNTDDCADADVLLAALGASVFAVCAVIMVVLRARFGYPIHPSFWALMSAGALSTAVLGWGLPRVRR